MWASQRMPNNARQAYRQRVKNRRAELKASNEMPTTQGERIGYDSLYTGKLTKSSIAKKDLLNHANSMDALEAAKYVWNNPSSLRKVRVSPLGEGKDMSKPENVRNINKKRKRNITNFNVYRTTYRGRRWVVKTAQYKKGYETLYAIQ
jgi:hypothetical protein